MMNNAMPSPTVWLIYGTEARSKALQAVLESAQLAVRTFVQPEDALSALEEGASPPDLIVTGLHMRGLGGLRFCRLLRAPAYTQANETPVLVVSTTYSGMDSGYLARALGVNAFCALPVADDVLLARVDDLLAGRAKALHPLALLAAPDSAIRQEWQDSLERLAYEIESVEDLPHALERCATGPLDVLIIAASILGEDHRAAMADLRRETGDCAIVVFEDQEMPIRATQWMALGANAVLREPLDPVYLAQACECAREERFLRKAGDLLLERSEVLEQSEARFRRIVETANEGVWEMGAQGITTFLNAQMAAMLGYTQEEMLGRPVTDFLPEDEHPGFLASIEARRRGESGIYERRYLAKDGHEVWALLSGAPRFAPDGTFEGCFAMVSDITERKQTVQALLESEERYRRIVQTANEGVWQMDAEGRITYVNERMIRMLGFGVDEMLGHLTTEFLHPDDLAEHRVGFERRKKGVSEAFERRLRTKGGEYIHVLVSTSPLFDADDAFAGSFAMVSDITDRKRAEESLARERAMLRIVIDNIPFSVYAKDLEGRKTVANRANQARLGVTSEADLLGKTDFDTYPPDRAEVLWAQDRRVMDDEQSVLNFEEQLTDASGQPRWLLTSKVPLRDAEGRVIGLVGIGNDITERRLAELALLDNATFLQTLIDAIPNPIFYKDAQGRFLGCNRAAEEYGGTSREELIGKTVYDTSPPDLAAIYARADAELLANPGRQTYEAMFSMPDGSRRNVIYHKATFTDAQGNVQGLVGVIQDITDRVQMEQTLARERLLLRTVIDNLPLAVFAKDLQGRKTLTNPVDLAWIGATSEDEVLGKTDQEVYHDERGEQYEDDDAIVLATGQPVLDNEVLTQDAQGNPRWTWGSKLPLIDADGQILGIVGVAQDITERKLVRDALARERLLLRTVIDNLPHAIYAKDLQGRKILTNPADMANIGVTSEEEVLGKTDRDLFSPEVADCCEADDRIIWETGQPALNREDVLVNAQGRRVWLLSSKLPLRDASGELIGLVGIGENITERKLAEEALRESEERYRRIVETANEGVWQVDAESRTVFVNPRMAAMLGYTPEEMLGRRVYDFIVTEEVAEHRARIVPRRQGESDVYERRFLSKDGRVVWCLVSASPVLTADGQYAGALGMLSDITERKRAEEELARERLLLRTVIDNIPLTIYAKDLQGRKILSNRADLAAMGLSSEEDALGRTDAEIYPDEKAEVYTETDRMVLASGEPMLDYEQLRIGEGGERKWVLTSKIPLKTAQGDIIGLVGMGHDITERKLAEEALRRSEAELSAIYENAPAIMLMIDHEHRVRKVNSYASTMLGRSPSDMLGMCGGDALRCVQAVTSPAGCGTGPCCDACDLRRAVMDTLETGRRHHQVEASLTMEIQGQQTPCAFLLSTARLDDGDQPRVLLSLLDITDRMAAEQALRESEERFRRIVETANEGVWQDDGDGHLTYVNAQLAKIMGYTPEEMIGQPASKYLHPDDAELSERMDRRRHQGLSDIYERRFVGQGGRIIWALVSASPMLTAEGVYAGSFAMVSDITARRQAEEALRESEERYRRISTLMSDYAYAYTVHADGALELDWIAGDFERITGLSAEESEARGGWAALIYPEDMPVAMRRHDRLLAGQEDVSEFRIVRADGEVRWLRDHGYPVWNHEEQRVVRIYGGAADITERKQAQEILARERALLRTVIDNLPLSVYVKDMQGRKTITNPIDLALMGFESPEQALGKTDAEVYPPDIAAIGMGNDAQVFATGEAILGAERPLRNKRGEVRWLSHSKVPLFDAEHRVIGLVGLANDITERRRSEEALRESEARFRRLAENAPDLIYRIELTPERRFSYVSPVATAMTGYTPEEHYADPDLGFKLVHPDDRHLLEEVALGDTRSGAPVTLRWVRKDGVVIWTEQRNVSVYDAEGNLIAIEGIARDVTDRKLAEEALTRERALLRTVIDHLPMAVYAKDVDGRKILTNPFDLLNAGASSSDEVLGKTDWDTYPPDLAAVFAQEDRQVIESGQALLVPEATARIADGGESWVSFAKLPLKDAEGKVIGLVGITQNISERKQIEIALRESEERARRQRAALARLAVDRVIAEGDVSAAMARLAEEMANTVGVERASVWLLSPDDARLRCISLFEKGQSQPCSDIDLETASFPSYFVALRAEGRVCAQNAHTDPRTCELTEGYLGPLDIASLLDAAILIDGKLVGVVSMEHVGEPRLWYSDEEAFASTAAAMAAQVLTNDNRRSAELALARERTLLRTVIDNLPTSVYAKDLQGRKTLANRANLDIMKVSFEEDVLGKTDRAFYPDDIAARFEANDEYVLTTGQAILNREQHAYYDDGTPRWLLTSKLPLRDASGEIIGLVGITHDITERKRAEQDRLEMERQLLHTQKLESLGVLAGGIAHDFNNLLMAILGNLDLALLDLSPLSPARESITQAMQAGRRAADVARQMLAYSGKGRFVVQSVNLAELVEENAHMLRAAIAKGVTLNLQLTHDIPPIEADPGQLQQVVINLITNASEAIGDRPGIVRLATGMQMCDAAYLAHNRLPNKPDPGRYVYVEVSDTGDGMSEETLERIFEPFYTTKATGRGLGMAAVQGIVSGHGGAIMIESSVGHGTTVRVLFRAAEGDETVGDQADKRPTSGVEEEPSSAAPRGATVLVVDDEEMVRRLTVAMLTRLGYVVLEAEDGEHALEVYQNTADPIDCVLLDLTMPRMDGAATFEQLHAIAPALPVILSSGYSEHENAERFAGLGLAGFIQKPYSLSSLSTALEKVLGGGG